LFFDPTDLSGTTEKFNLDLFSYIPYGVMKKKEVFFKCLQWCSNNRELIAQSKVIFRTLQKAFVIPFTVETQFEQIQPALAGGQEEK
jgi:hypothetical protein